MDEKINIRMLAMQILLDVEQNHKFLNDTLHTMLRRYQYISKQERSFLTRLCEGTVENQIYLDYIINAFSKTKVAKCKPVIRTILRMSVYQICFMDSVPDTAAVNEAVKLAKKKGFHPLTGFVNGVLRNVVRGYQNVILPDENMEPVKYLSVRYSMPEWLVEYLQTYYEYSVLKGMLSSFHEHHGTCIRVNRSKCEPEILMQKLSEQGIEVCRLPYVEYGLRIRGYNYMQRVPGFRDGSFAVQDVSSMLVGQVLDPAPESVVLDLCAAPGGKSLDVCDRLLYANAGQTDSSHGLVIARDISQEKIDKIAENQQRMGFDNLKLEIYDAMKLDETMVGKADYVICDVPCSGLGVIGRKPEIKYRLTEEQLDSLVEIQRQILSQAWRYLKPGGVMVFSTCTLNPKENEENLFWLLANAPLEAESLNPYLPGSLHSGQTTQGYLTLIPGLHDCDGFFLSRLRRV